MAIASAHEAGGFDGCILDDTKQFEGEIALNVLAEIFGEFHGLVVPLAGCEWPCVLLLFAGAGKR